MKQLKRQIMPRALFLAALAFASTGVHADGGHDKKPAAGDMGDMGSMDHGKMEMGDGHWMAPPEAARRKNPISADKASIARGKKIYAANCASCHGVSGKGDGTAGKTLTPKPTNLAAMAPQHAAGDLGWKIENGRGAMPAWKSSLTQDQIWDVVNFLQTLAPPTADDKKARDAHAGHAH